jgi:hypothetical protein
MFTEAKHRRHIDVMAINNKTIKESTGYGIGSLRTGVNDVQKNTQ